jgi:hypothetical protein
MTAIEQLILTNQIALMLAIRDWMRPSSSYNADLARQVSILTDAVRITGDAIENAEAKE